MPTPVGPGTVLNVAHSGLDTAGNPETLSKAQARLVDSMTTQQGTIKEAAWVGSPTPVALGGFLTEVPIATYTLQFRVIDAAGHVSVGDWQTFGQVVLDGTPPAAPTATIG